MNKLIKYIIISILLLESILLFTGCTNNITNNTIIESEKNTNYELTKNNIQNTSIASESDFILEYGKENQYRYFDNLPRNDGLSSRYAYKLPAGNYKITLALDKSLTDTTTIYKFNNDNATSCKPITFSKNDYIRVITISENESISIEVGSCFYVKKI